MADPVVATLEIPADSRYLATARQFVADAAESEGWFDRAKLDDLRLMVSETVTNAFRAHADRNVDEMIRIATAAFTDRFEVTVSDSAGGFVAPTMARATADPDLNKDGGFGLGLIGELSDEAHFTLEGDGTVVRLVMYRNEAGTP